MHVLNQGNACMKKQFLHEAHNLQDKAKKPDYQEDFQDEGATYDRGGASSTSPLSFRGSSLYIDLKPFLREDKLSLLATLDRHMKFIVHGKVGTIPQLMKNSQLADYIKQRHEMTHRSVIRADTFHVAQHPTKNRLARILEFDCFLQPLEPFTNPIPKHSFCFLLKVVQSSP
jgi:hypothetical protein